MEELKHLAESISLKPKGKDSSKLLWLINHDEKTQSDVIRSALNLLYFAKKTGRYEGLLDQMMDEFESLGFAHLRISPIITDKNKTAKLSTGRRSRLIYQCSTAIIASAFKTSRIGARVSVVGASPPFDCASPTKGEK